MDHKHMTMDDTTAQMDHAGHVITTAMDHGSMDHGSMDHAGHIMTTAMGHIMTTAMAMDHGSMDHGSMDHGSMDHGSMDHGSMNDGSMGSMHDMHGMDMNDTMGMKMYFHDGYKEYVLFQECLTGSVGAMVGACFAIFFLAILYEGLKFLREILLQRSLATRPHGTYDMGGLKAGSSQEQITTQIRNPSVSSRILSCGHFVQTILHMVQVFISYCLMLVFMTYNVWLCLAVIVGAGVGYFIFGWKRAVVVDSNEHCH